MWFNDLTKQNGDLMGDNGITYIYIYMNDDIKGIYSLVLLT